ncbi:MAG: GNAT family N-acetyltransferase [bacterium]|nr:GNAT family N-acetyltransferase [bacterium]
MKVIDTERLSIELASDEYMEQMIRDEKDEGLKQAYSEMLQGAKANPNQREWNAIWIVRLRENPNISVGEISFKGLSDLGVIEIGYGVQPGFERQGYMTEAVTGMVRWAGSQPEVRQIEAETESENVASRRVLQKAGFVENGVMGEEGPRFVWSGKNKSFINLTY